MQTVLAVVRHALVPRRERDREVTPGQALFPFQPGAFVGLGRRVLGRLGQRHERVRGHERRGEQLLLERLEPGEVGPERDHTEIRLVAEHRDAERLVTVGFERRDRVDDALRRARLALGPLPIDAVVEMKNAPADGRRHRIHARRG